MCVLSLFYPLKIFRIITHAINKKEVLNIKETNLLKVALAELITLLKEGR